MWPVSAEAATVAGEPRKISASALPILPMKLRLCVPMQRSPGPRSPPCPPKHGPHPGGEDRGTCVNEC